MQTILISGGNASERKEWINRLIEKKRISKFDLHIVIPEPSIGIEHVKKLKEILSLKTFSSTYRALVFLEFDKATHEAQNALLKTLEEPPENTYIIITTQNADLLLPTIISRCQLIKLPDLHLDENYDLLSINKILTLSSGEKILLAETYAQNREACLSFLLKSIKNLRKELKDAYIGSREIASNIPQIEKLTIIRKFINAYFFIQKNINTRLTLEVLFIGLDSSKFRQKK